MSMVNAVVLFTLNWTVLPTLAEMSEVKPLMSSLPVPTISHSDLGLPGLEFSHATALPVTHGSAWAAPANTGSEARPRTRAISVATGRHARRGVPRPGRRGRT